MKKYECLNVVQVRKKIMELTFTGVMDSTEIEYWKSVCHTIKGDGLKNNFDTVDYTGGNGEDLEIWIGWDAEYKL